jgi:hypothetical protein
MKIIGIIAWLLPTVEQQVAPPLQLLPSNQSVSVSAVKWEHWYKGGRGSLVEVIPFGDFVHYLHREVDAGQHGCKTTEYKSTDSLLPPLLNVMYCVRVFLRTVKLFLAQH